MCLLRTLVQLVEPNQTDIDCIEETVLLKLFYKALVRGLAFVCAEDLNENTVGDLCSGISLFIAEDHHKENMIVGHISVAKNIFIANQGFILINQILTFYAGRYKRTSKNISSL